MTSMDAMHCHTLLCKSMATGNDDDNREESLQDYEEEDNGDDDFKFRFKED